MPRSRKGCRSTNKRKFDTIAEYNNLGSRKDGVVIKHPPPQSEAATEVQHHTDDIGEATDLRIDHIEVDPGQDEKSGRPDTSSLKDA